MNTQNFRKPFLLALLVSMTGLGGALLLQYVYHMHPCPLCVTQRIALLGIGLLSLIGLVMPGRGRAVLGAFGVLGALAGFCLASWHTAHVLFPPQEQSCAPGLGYWLDHLWITDRLPWLLSPSGDCIKDAASFMGVPLPAYSAIFFVFLAGIFRKAARTGRTATVTYSPAQNV